MIPFVDLARQHEPLKDELRGAFDRVAASGAFTLGEEVEGFEAEFAAFCGAADCVGVSSGTSALSLALRAGGIGPGDEVIVPAHTFIASALGVAHAGARAVFCDVDPATGLIDPAAAAAAIGPATAAILAVHLYGQVCDMEALRAIAGRHELLLVEDAAQAHGAERGGLRAGAQSDVGCFSFYPSKNLGALGDGGAVVTDNPGLARRVRELRNLGQRAKSEHVVLGYNERLDGLQAALLRVKLPHLDAWNAARQARAAEYRELLPAGTFTVSDGVFHLFPIRAADRDALGARLGAHGVQTGVHYPKVVPAQQPFHDPAQPAHAFPSACAWAAEELSLPMFAELEPREVEHVARALELETSYRSAA